MAAAVLYYEDTAKVIKRYKSLAAAKAALTRATNAGRMRVNTSYGKGLIREKDIARLAVVTVDYFNERVDYEVEVKNIMSKKMVKIRRSEVGGPCDPSMELYWSI